MKTPSKAEALRIGAQGLEVPASGLRNASFAWLRAGGQPLPAYPVTVAFEGAMRYIVDGRHRIALARAAGEQRIKGVLEGRGPRGGLVWSHTGWFPI